MTKIDYMPGNIRITVDIVQPHVGPPRGAQIVLKVAIKKELNTMEENGIIQRVTEPTDWVSS